MKKIKRLVIFVFVLVAFVFSLCVLSSAASSVAEPQNAQAYNLDGAVKLTWSKNSKADYYEVYKLGSNGKWQKAASPKGCSFVDKNVSDGDICKYKVRTVSKDGKSGFVRLSYEYLSVPKITVVYIRSNGLEVKWNECKNADGYRLYRRTAGSTTWKTVAVLGKGTLSYTDKTAKNGVKYYYTLRQLSGNYRSMYSKTGRCRTYLAPATGLTARNSPSGVTLSWSKVSQGKSLEIYRKVSGGKWTKITSVKASRTSYIDKSASYGRKNSYLIKVVLSDKIKSAYSASAQVYAVNPKKPMVALTYDDGPYRPVTNSILDTLSKNGARATFFVVGSRLATYSDCLERENSLGCEIGCHTYNHTTLTAASDATIISEISKTNELIKKYTGQTVKLVRAPGGSVNSRVKSVVPLPLVNWSVDTMDWKNRSSSATYANFKNGVRDGSIVLMHDLYPSTAEATKSIVAYLKQNGYQIVTVSEMMDAKGITMQKGQLYTRA